MRRALPAVLAVLLAALLSAGCGVPQDDQPRALDRIDAPFQVFPQEGAPEVPNEPVQVELWLVREDRLVPVQRPVEAPATPRQVLEQLFKGPTEAQSAEGLSTAIPSAFRVEDVVVRDRIAVVTLSGLGEQVRTDNNVAFAQIVATLDARPDIDGVRFRTEDGDLSVPRGDGSLTDEAVNRESYAKLIGEVGSAKAGVVPPPPVPPASQPATEPAGGSADDGPA